MGVNCSQPQLNEMTVAADSAVKNIREPSRLSLDSTATTQGLRDVTVVSRSDEGNTSDCGIVELSPQLRIAADPSSTMLGLRDVRSPLLLPTSPTSPTWRSARGSEGGGRRISQPAGRRAITSSPRNASSSFQSVLQPHTRKLSFVMGAPDGHLSTGVLSTATPDPNDTPSPSTPMLSKTADTTV